jgi:isoleucyl-tRNA synthetase
VTAVGSDQRFRLLAADASANALEEELLARWREENLFARTLEAHAGGTPWVFFEGPPTANGRPGIHHVFARTIKDLFCRHRAMKGHFVLRKAGWDTHGLPVEIEVEKQLPALLAARGMSDEEIARCSGKQLIEAFGVEEFNRLCRESVWKYQGDWERLSERIGYWLDYDNAYVTYTNDYVESVWWALATLHDKGYLTRGHKILPYCPRCGTTLSSHEVALGYQDVADPSVYVALNLRDWGELGREALSAEEPSTGREAWAAESPVPSPLVPAPQSPVPSPQSRRRILVWTTTPWTLVSNVALAVHPELDYVELTKKTGTDWTIILAEARAGAVLGEDYRERWETVGRFPGSMLVGARYERPLDWVSFDGVAGDHGVIVGEDFVSADDGSGVVHLAPAFGADDYAAGQRHGLAFVQPVNARGEFPADMPVVGGKFVKKADPLIIEELDRRDALWKAGTLTHAYPHCWRCGTPLLYYARASWFIRTTAFKDEMLARNARVDWHPPEVGAGRFGEWLENNIDWAISRDRYWGTPLPVWVNDEDPTEIEVIGSFAALAERAGVSLGADFDPHKPYIDRHTWPARSGRGTMRRVPDVIDAWFDSGAMSFAQWHYPFENRETLATQYPADFIAEGVDQTRGWFYSLLAIAAGLGDALPNNTGSGKREAGSGETAGRYSVEGQPEGVQLPASRFPLPAEAAPYKAVVVNDLVLDAHGVKMSKRLGNIVDPWTVIPKYGADAVRLFLVSSSQVWKPRAFDEAQIREGVTQFLVTLRNVYSGMFALYANFGWEPSPVDPAPADRPAIDRWMLSRLATVEADVDSLLEAFDATAAAKTLMSFLVDDVSNWYVRRSRARFYEVSSPDNRAAFATLHEVLVVTARLLAPLAPFLSDWMHRELTGTSVHLAPYRRAGAVPADAALERAMREIRTLARLGRAAREDAGIKVRQPLSRLVCVVPRQLAGDVGSLFDLLEAELNVKRVELASSADSLVTLEAKPNFRSLGKKFGKSTPLAAQAVAAFTSDELRAFEHGQPLAISVGNEARTLDHEDLVIVRRATGALTVKEEDGRFAAIDPTVTPELRREGIARELVSQLQRLRRDLGFAVSDRIRLWIAAPAETNEAIIEYNSWIANELLAREIVAGEAPAGQQVHELDLDGSPVRAALSKEL